MTPAVVICPLCLTERTDRPAGSGCPWCLADHRPVPLMARDRYLAEVDFETVAAFWDQAPPERREVARRVLDRVDRLRAAQRREFGGAAALSARPADPRVRVLN